MDSEFHKGQFLDRESNNQGYWSSTMPRQHLNTLEKQLPDYLHCTSSAYLNAPVTIQNKDLFWDSVEKKVPEGAVNDVERKLLWGKRLEKGRGLKGHWATITGWGRKVEVVRKETPRSSSGRSWLEAEVVQKMTGVGNRSKATKGVIDPREGIRTTIYHHGACSNTMVTRFLFSWKARALPQWTSLVCPAAPDPRDAAQLAWPCAVLSNSLASATPTGFSQQATTTQIKRGKRLRWCWFCLAWSSYQEKERQNKHWWVYQKQEMVYWESVQQLLLWKNLEHRPFNSATYYLLQN